MRLTATTITLLTLLLPPVALGDGYSFNEDAHEITWHNIQLVLSDSQVDEVSATGTLTFAEEQRTLLKRFFANIPPKIWVISSTLNDGGVGERDPNTVDCIWTSPAHVGIPLISKEGDADYVYVTQAGSCSRLRLSPDGDIYSDGSKISKEAALEVIRNAKLDGVDTEPAVGVTLPPPYREKELAESNVAVRQLFDELVRFGKRIGVIVHQCL